MWGSKFFTLAELTRSDLAIRHGIDNEPDVKTIVRLADTAERLDLVRQLLGNPVMVSSGFRCLRVNRILGSSDMSAHVLGYAVDFTCPYFGTPLEVARAIFKAGIKFDQLIYEGSWVHISFDPRFRREVLTARFHAGRPTIYEAGLNA